MITPNRVKLDGEEITDEDIALDIKETKLRLQMARLKVGLEDNPIQKPEEPKHTEEEAKRKILLDQIPF